MTNITTFPIPTKVLNPADYPEFKGEKGDQGLKGDPGDQGPPGTIENGMTVVTHDATANTARPTGAAAVYWKGSVEPNNAIDGDLWIGADTLKARMGGIFGEPDLNLEQLHATALYF